MSENLDLVRSIYADWERGDFGSAEWAHPQIEWEYVGGPEPSKGIGIGDLGRAMRTWLPAWNRWQVAAAEYRELDELRVLVLDENFATGKTSGIEMRSQAANLFEVRDGNVTRFLHYWERDRALSDLGLEE
jgi:ketosteroid isomerase-like protein